MTTAAQPVQVSRNKALKGMPSHLERAEGVVFGQSTIDYLMLNVPPACNYRCEKCFTWANMYRIKDYLKTDQVLDLVRQGAEMGAKVVAVIGEGEPTLYLDRFRKKVDYVEIIKECHRLGMITLMATNASLLDKEMVDFLYQHNVSLAVSIDTMDVEEYNSFFRGQADLRKVLANMEYARKVYAGDIYERNGVRVHRLGVHMTVTSKNYGRIKDIVEYCGDDIYFDCDHLAEVGVANDNPTLAQEIEACQRASRTATLPMVTTSKPAACGGGETCCLFYYGLAIGYEGEVMVDTHAVETKHVVGHVDDAPLADLLAKAQEYRDVYFNDFGNHPCIIRNPQYPQFLEYLEGEKRRRITAGEIIERKTLLPITPVDPKNPDGPRRPTTDSGFII